MMEGTLMQAAESMHGVLSGHDRSFRGVSTDTRTLQAGEALFEEGEAARHVYVVLRGRLEVLKREDPLFGHKAQPRYDSLRNAILEAERVKDAG